MPPTKRKAKWSEEDVNARAPSFYVMQAKTSCWRCRGQTAVIGFALAPGFELREWENEAQKAHAPGYDRTSQMWCSGWVILRRMLSLTRRESTVVIGTTLARNSGFTTG